MTIMGKAITKIEKEEIVKRYQTSVQATSEHLNSVGIKTADAFQPLLHIKNSAGVYQPLRGFSFSTELLQPAIEKAQGGRVFVELGATAEGKLTPVLTVMDAEGSEVGIFEFSFPCPPYCP